jgi:hypothetical protein
VFAVRALGVDDAAAELDRRDVALSARAQAHDEACCFARDATLVRMGDHRRVEERGCFERILAREVGTGEQETLLAQLDLGTK